MFKKCLVNFKICIIQYLFVYISSILNNNIESNDVASQEKFIKKIIINAFHLYLVHVRSNVPSLFHFDLLPVITKVTQLTWVESVAFGALRSEVEGSALRFEIVISNQVVVGGKWSVEDFSTGGCCASCTYKYFFLIINNLLYFDRVHFFWIGDCVIILFIFEKNCGTVSSEMNIIL